MDARWSIRLPEPPRPLTRCRGRTHSGLQGQQQVGRRRLTGRSRKRARMILRTLAATLAVTLLAGLSPAAAQNAGGATTATAGAMTAAPNNYADPATWLCRPERLGACGVDLTTTVVAADGKMTREAYRAASNPKIDCFYVYPTVSHDLTPNSDMTAGPEELGVVQAQFARFGAKCRLFAPLYRQVTLTALRAGMTGQPDEGGPRARLQRREGGVGVLPRPRQQGPRRRADRAQPGLWRADPADQDRDRRQARAGQDRLGAACSAQTCRSRQARWWVATSSRSRSAPP